MINRYVWELYLKSGGEQTVNFFRDNLYEHYSSDYALGIRRMQEYYCVSKGIIDDTEWQLQALDSVITEGAPDEWQPEDEELSDDELVVQAIKDIDEIFENEYNFILSEEKSDKSAFQYFSYNCNLHYYKTFEWSLCFLSYNFYCYYY